MTDKQEGENVEITTYGFAGDKIICRTNRLFSTEDKRNVFPRVDREHQGHSDVSEDLPEVKEVPGGSIQHGCYGRAYHLICTVRRALINPLDLQVVRLG